MRVYVIDTLRFRANGVVTYMPQLLGALRAAGHEPRWVRVANRTEGQRRFGLGGEAYWNLSLRDTLALGHRERVFLASSDAADKELQRAPELVGASRATMVHHPVEASPAMVDAWRRHGTRLLATRPPLVGMLRDWGLDAHLVRLPYRRMGPFGVARTRHAVACTRITPEKHTELICRANRRLPEGRRATIFGVALPGYYSTLSTKVPGWDRDYGGRFGAREHTGPRLAASATYALDMTLRPVDGGGTQYCTLEAWDAGAIPVVQAGWVARGTGDADDLVAGVDCLAVDGEDALVALLASDVPDPAPFRAAGARKLALHDPATCGRELTALLGWGE